MKIKFPYVRIKAWKELVKVDGWKPIEASRAVASVEVPMVEASTENIICECAGGIKHDFLWSDVESKFVAGVHQNG